MSSPLSLSPIALTELVIPKKHHRKDKRDSFGRKVAFILSPEFLAKFVDWRQSRLELLPSKCTFDRWHEALLKEHVWHQWMLEGLVKNMDIPTRNILAHLYVHAKTPATEQKMGSANLKRGLLEPRAQSSHSQQILFSCELIDFPRCSCAVGGRRDNPKDPPETARCLQPDRCSRGPRCGLRSPRHIGRGLSPKRRRGGGGGCPC